MKEEIGHLPEYKTYPRIAILCHCCRTQLFWIEINKYYSCAEVQGYKEYICDACVRDGKINAILSLDSILDK
jgi:hypothetical protein